MSVCVCMHKKPLLRAHDSWCTLHTQINKQAFKPQPIPAPAPASSSSSLRKGTYAQRCFEYCVHVQHFVWSVFCYSFIKHGSTIDHPNVIYVKIRRTEKVETQHWWDIKECTFCCDDLDLDLDAFFRCKWLTQLSVWKTNYSLLSAGPNFTKKIHVNKFTFLLEFFFWIYSVKQNLWKLFKMNIIFEIESCILMRFSDYKLFRFVYGNLSSKLRQNLKGPFPAQKRPNNTDSLFAKNLWKSNAKTQFRFSFTQFQITTSYVSPISFIYHFSFGVDSSFEFVRQSFRKINPRVKRIQKL